MERSGSSRFAESSLEFLELYHPEGKIVRNTMPASLSGFVVRILYGDYGMGATIERCEVWPVTLLTHTDPDWTAGDEVATFTIPVAITGYPILNAIVPVL